MSSRAVYLGFLIAFLLPIAIALSAHFFWNNTSWTPRYTSHGHLYSPAIFCPLSEKKKIWSLNVLYLQDQNEITQNWTLIPRFFPKNEIDFFEVYFNDLPENTKKTLLEQIVINEESNMLLLQDPEHFIAISFSEHISHKDIIQDLKKILPKHSTRKA